LEVGMLAILCTAGEGVEADSAVAAVGRLTM